MKLVFLTTDISDFTQQDGMRRKKRKTRVKRLCVTNVTRLLLACLSWSSLDFFFFVFLFLFLFFNKKNLFKGWWRLVERVFKQNYCHACHTRFAVFFPFPCCCVCSLKLINSILASNKTLVLEHPVWTFNTLLLVAIEPQSGKMIFKIWSVLSVYWLDYCYRLDPFISYSQPCKSFLK